MSIERIKNYVPHRYPFLLLDKIIHEEAGKELTAIKNVTINEPIFQGHFPEMAIFPQEFDYLLHAHHDLNFLILAENYVTFWAPLMPPGSPI